MKRKDFLKIIGVGAAVIAVPLSPFDTHGNPTKPELRQGIRCDEELQVGDILWCDDATLIVTETHTDGTATVRSLDMQSETFKITSPKEVIRVGTAHKEV